MTPPRRACEVCPLCGNDDFITEEHVGDEWIVTCSSKTHPALYSASNRAIPECH